MDVIDRNENQNSNNINIGYTSTNARDAKMSCVHPEGSDNSKHTKFEKNIGGERGEPKAAIMQGSNLASLGLIRKEGESSETMRLQLLPNGESMSKEISENERLQLLPINIASNQPDSEQTQCEKTVRIGESNYIQEKPIEGGVGAPIPEINNGVTDGVTCMSASPQDPKDVSELKEEVFSYQEYIHSKEKVEAFLNNEQKELIKNKSSNTAYEQILAAVTSIVTHEPELALLKKSIVQHHEGSINMQDCIKEIKEMVTKAKCTEIQKQQIEELCLEYKEQFCQGFGPEFKAGNSKFIPHDIQLDTDVPIWTHQFRQSPEEKRLADNMALEQEKQGVIEKTMDSFYNSPAMCVPKKDGTWRPVIDYRVINKHTKRENWHIPRADEAHDALINAKYMSTIDATSGYWQIPLTERSKQFTAFTTMSARWQYVCLPMGITNAAPTFQKNMEAMLYGMLWKNCIVYIDDIIVYSNTFKEHIQHLREVLRRLKAANIVIKPSKCNLCQSEVEYLGHIVGNGQLKTTQHNIEKVKSCELPKTLTEVRAFCNLAGYYRKFIKNYAEIAKPLTELMSQKGKKTRVTLSEEATAAFHKLKELVCEEPVLQLPDYEKPFILRTDASGYAIGAVLAQKDKNGDERPVSFASRTLTAVERRYSAGEREMLAIMYFIKYWHTYLWGRHFSVYTDHSPLTGIKTKKDVTRRLSRMILALQAYDYELHYTPGKENGVADALSRKPIAPKYKEIPIKDITELLNVMSDNYTIDKNRGEGDAIDLGVIPFDLQSSDLMSMCFAIIGKGTNSKNKSTTLNKDVVTIKELKKTSKNISILSKRKIPFEIPPSELAQMQLEDETLESCINATKLNSTNTNSVWMLYKDCLHRIRQLKRRKEKSIQLVLPLKLREDIMTAYHDELLAGHCGYFKTAHKIAQWYWWPNMYKDIKEWVKSCTTCQQYGKVHKHNEGKLVPIVATRPFQIMGMDIMEIKGSQTKSGNNAIVVFTDYFTKWVEAYAIPNQQATTIAQKLIQGVLCRHGAPERIISDRGPNFTSDVFRSVTDMLGMKQNMTSGYHPQADGQSERLIGTLKNLISKLAKDNHQDWDLYLPYALWAYRTATHAVTKESPFFLVYGRDPTNPADLRIRQ